MKADEQTPIERIELAIQYYKTDYKSRKYLIEEIDKYAELRIQQELQQEREKWKEEVISFGAKMHEKGFNDSITSLNSDGKISFNHWEESVNEFETKNRK